MKGKHFYEKDSVFKRLVKLSRDNCKTIFVVSAAIIAIVSAPRDSAEVPKNNVLANTSYHRLSTAEPIDITVESVEPVDVSSGIEEPIVHEEPTMSSEDIDLIALVTMAEAEGECEEGKRLVIDVILNRIDSTRFDDTVHDVVYASGAFSSMWNGRVDRCYVMGEIRELVLEELECRTNYEVLYFRTDHYHNFGTPIMQVGNHYFSTT